MSNNTLFFFPDKIYYIYSDAKILFKMNCFIVYDNPL